MSTNRKIEEVNLDNDTVTFSDGLVVDIEYWEDGSGERFDFPIDDIARVLFPVPGGEKGQFYSLEIIALTPENTIH